MNPELEAWPTKDEDVGRSSDVIGSREGWKGLSLRIPHYQKRLHQHRQRHLCWLPPIENRLDDGRLK